MNKLLSIIVFLLPLILHATDALPLPDLITQPVTFTVLDPEGQPVGGAHIEASSSGPGHTGGTTDQTGKLVLNLMKTVSLSLRVTKDGYYTTSGQIWRAGMDKGPEGTLIPRTLPDAFTIELKDVRNPVPMSHLSFRGRAPISDEPVGFDMKVSDWVAPYGMGQVPDLLFHFKDPYVSDTAFSGTMVISFPNKGDGIQAFQAGRPFSTEFGSNLAPPHEAPLDGYLPRLTYSKSHREGEEYEGYRKKGRNYILRTRTVLDAQGNILEACYGFIIGEIEFDPRDPSGPQLAFVPYLNANPDPEDRSLEYDQFVPRNRR